MTRTGRMDRLIVIQRKNDTGKDSIGFKTKGLIDHKRLWAEVIPVSGTEILSSGREMTGKVSRFITWYKKDITVLDVVKYDGEVWDILSLRELGRRERLEITAQVRK